MRSALLVVFLACSGVGCVWSATEAQEWSRLDAEDEVFAAVLDSLFGSSHSDRRLVVRGTTWGVVPEQSPDVFRRSLEDFPELSPDAASDFLRINREPRRIEAIEHDRMRVEIVPDSVFTEFHGEDPEDPRVYWRRVRERFGGATTVVSFSRPGFNVARSEAFVEVGYLCGYLCGAGYEVLLRRSSDGWYVARLVRTSVS